MHSFLWSGRDGEGNERSERVDAENAQQAKAILASRGWTNLELVFDEICDAARQQLPPLPEDWDAPQENPDTEAARWKGWSPSFAREWMKAVFEAKGSIALFGLILAFGLFGQRRWPIIVGVAGLLFVVLLFPAISVFYSQTSRNYAKLNKAKVWGRWREVLTCIERLKRSHRLTRLGVGDVEIARNRALALANLGRLDEALREFARFEKDASVPQWLYLSFLAGIYDGAREFKKALELRRQVATEKPDASAVWIDIAYSLVRGLNRPTEAREALARAEALEITGLAKPYLFFLRGIILWREGKHSESEKQLEQALVDFEPMKHHDLVEGLVLFTKSYLCVVYGELGNLSRARAVFGEVESFLVAHREEELLQACRSRLLTAR